MITTLYILIALSLVIATMALQTVILGAILKRRESRHNKQFLDKYVEALSTLLDNKHSTDEAQPLKFPRIERQRSKLLLSKLLATLAQSTYGYDSAQVKRIVELYKLDRFLERRARFTRALKRAGYIKLLMRMPMPEKTLTRLGQYTFDRNAYVRLYALMLQIYHSPDLTLDKLREHPFILNDFELSQISTLLLHSFVPSAIVEPLLESNHSNHLRLGLELARRMDIETVQPRIIKLVAHPSHDVRDAALHTLVTMKLSITERSVVETVSQMSSAERKSFYRLLVSEGYSLRALREFIASEHEDSLDQYITRTLTSHKRNLVNDIPSPV